MQNAVPQKLRDQIAELPANQTNFVEDMTAPCDFCDYAMSLQYFEENLIILFL